MVSNQITYKTTDRNHPYEIIRDYEGYESEKNCSSELMCADWEESGKGIPS
jgi:hypothetical protein